MNETSASSKLWTVPDLNELLSDFKTSTPNLDLVDTYMAAGNVAALRSIFQMLFTTRDRAEHLSKALIAYIQLQSTRDPQVRQYFDTMMSERDLELRSAGLRSRSAGQQEDSSAPKSPIRQARPRSATPKPPATPAAPADW